MRITHVRYFLAMTAVPGSEHEVTKAQFMEGERNAGFQSKFEGEPATGGFTGNGIAGRISYDAPPQPSTRTKTGKRKVRR